MIMLFTTAVGELFKQFVLQALCYPSGYVMPDVPWGLNRALDDIRSDVESLKNEQALIVIIDSRSGKNDEPVPEYIPLRMTTITKARKFAGKLLLDLRLGECVYYSEAVKAAYDEERKAYDEDRSPQPMLIPNMDGKFWNLAIGMVPGAPKPGRTKPTVPMKYSDWTTWQTIGPLILRYSGPTLDLLPSEADTERIRMENEAWKSVVDRAVQCTMLEHKLFYQVYVFSAAQTPMEPDKYLEKQVYALRSGDHVDLFIHFYFGEKKRREAPDVKLAVAQPAQQNAPAAARPTKLPRQLEVIADSRYLASVGSTLIDTYPDQWTGNVERVHLIAKRQLTDDVTRVRIQEHLQSNAPAGTTSALAAVELYFRIVPRRMYVAGVLGLFAAGSFLNAVPDDFGPPDLQFSWGWKVLGSLMMAGAFWIGFSKLPSKGG